MTVECSVTTIRIVDCSTMPQNNSSFNSLKNVQS
jgi:hypothetical protein